MKNRRSSFFVKAYCPVYLGLALCAAALLWAAESRAADVTLAWDQSPDPVTGYKLFYGEQSVLSNPATEIDVGNVLQYTFTTLTPGTAYYFALKAYNAYGQSGFSNEVTYTVPASGSTTTSTSLTTTSSATTSITTTTSTIAMTTVPTTTSVPTTSSTSTLPTTSVTTTSMPTTTSTALTTSPTSSSTSPVTTTTAPLTSTTTTPATITSTALTTSSTSSSTSPVTTTTAPLTSTTTTPVMIQDHYIMGGRGSNFIEGRSAAKSQQNAMAESKQLFTEQGAIALFDEQEAPVQISVGWDEYNALNGEARIATGDIDGDGEEEIIIGLGPVEGNSAIPGGRFQILDDDFTSLGWGRIDWSEYNSVNGESWPACGDIDGDGVDEILIGLGIGGNGRVEVFNFDNGQAVHSQWIKVGWEEYCVAGGGVRPACGNIDFDRKNEIILGLYPVNYVFLPEGKFEVLDGNAEHLAWGVVDWPDYNALNGETRPACGNIDRTVRDEILFGLGTGSDGRIPVYSYAMGQVTLNRWMEAGSAEYRAENGETRLSCGNTDSDRVDEILIGFGPGGQGMMELHDDWLHEFSLMSSLQMPDEDYNSAIGETNPAIKGIKSRFPRIMNFFLK